MITDLFKYVIKNLFIRITRSSLTIISIMVGIMAIFALLSFGEGLKTYVNSVAEDMGTNLLIAQPRGAGAPGTTGTYLSADDLDFIRKQKGIVDATGFVFGNAEIKDNPDKKGKWSYVIGLSIKPDEIKFVEDMLSTLADLESGRNLKAGDSKKAVLGYNYQVADRIFEKPLGLGDKIFINDIKFEVIGFYEEIGNPADDSQAYISNDDAEEVLGLDSTEYGMIYIESEDGLEPGDVAERLEDRLRKFKDQKEGQEDFAITTFESQLEMFNQVINVLNGILFLIALVSVLVAAVNIANTMYTAVMERTKEIGIMKAIGARNSYIRMIFVLESGILGLLGGILGILLGYLISRLGGMIAKSAGYALLKPAFPLWLIVGCLFFAFLVGTVSGFFPAKQASELSPVEALREE
ncbi:ABC transporter permease [Candidatus Woesearchaeota archaeon]|nr:ABC transporter permease [Candidatus Woesearchaeota archaeon]